MKAEELKRVRSATRTARAVAAALAAAVALTAGALVAQAQKVKLPETPAGRRLGQFFEAIGSNDSAKWKKFAAEGHAKSFLEKRSVDEVVAMLQQMHERQGGFDLVKIEKSEPHEISVQARNKEEGRIFWIDIKVEPKEPFGIVGVGFDTQPPGQRPKGPGKVIERQ